MCGISGIFAHDGQERIDRDALEAMTAAMFHRGPDSVGYHLAPGIGLGFRRLSIIDLSGGNQPFYNGDRTLASVCNGEIYNYREFRHDLEARGKRFTSACDVEVLPHLYEVYGTDFIARLNGQFAFALYDQRRRRLILARDHAGIAPLFYTTVGGTLAFASEIKALLRHPGVRRKVDLRGLDQMLCFPGLVSPTTMFEGIHALEPGHFLVVEDGRLTKTRYWDMTYPREDEPVESRSEEGWAEELEALLRDAVRLRLNADVPVGFYLSGGLDSSLIGALIKQCSPESRHSFSIGFSETDIDERRHQHLMAEFLGSIHHETVFDWSHIGASFRDAVHFAETPLKETYNTCSLALSRSVADQGMKVVLTGEGADELFAGYVGYRFDAQRAGAEADWSDPEQLLAAQVQQQLWGDANFFYEKDLYAFRETRQALYSTALNARFAGFDCTQSSPVDLSQLAGRHPIHKRSYLDFKLRLSDHLVADHGDRVAYAHSVEARYPFLDPRVMDLAKRIPPSLKLNGGVEKYLLKRIAARHLPEAIVNREKFSFVAPGSPYLLQQNIPWLDDLLAPERIARQGYFNPDVVARLARRYRQPGFKLNVPFESDLLIVVISFCLFLDLFELPDFT